MEENTAEAPRVVYCPNCLEALICTPENYGKVVKCCKCGEHFEIPFPKALSALPQPPRPQPPPQTVIRTVEVNRLSLGWNNVFDLCFKVGVCTFLALIAYIILGIIFFPVLAGILRDGRF